MSNPGQVASKSSEEHTTALKHPSARWWVLAGLWLLYSSFGLLVASIAPIVIPIEESLDMTHAAMGTVMGAWQLVYIFSAVPCGVLLDKLGGRRALLIGASLIALSGLGRAFAPDYFSLLIAVMLFGLGGPIISSGAPKVVASLFSGSQRGLAMGVYMTGPAVGGVVCLTLTQSVLLPLLGGWREVMFLWAVIAIISGLVWWLICWRVGLADAVDTPNQSVPHTQVMRELWRQPAVKVLLLMSVGVFLFNHGLNNWLPQLLQTHGLTPAQAGIWAALPTVVGILGSLLIPRLATGSRRFAILLALCATALVASLLLQFEDYLSLSGGLILQGIARSSMMTVLILTLVELPGIGEARAGVASGMFFSAAEIGGVLGPVGLGVAYDLTGGFSLSLYALSGVALLLMLGTFYLRRIAREAVPD